MLRNVVDHSFYSLKHVVLFHVQLKNKNRYNRTVFIPFEIYPSKQMFITCNPPSFENYQLWYHKKSRQVDRKSSLQSTKFTMIQVNGTHVSGEATREQGRADAIPKGEQCIPE